MKKNYNTPLLLVLLIIFILPSNEMQAQRFKKLGKRLGDAVERGVTKRLEEETEESTDEVLDEVFEEKPSTRKKGKNKTIKSTRESQSKTSKSSGTQGRSPRQEQSASDFQPGKSVIYTDQFAQDAIGDFPVTWNTNTGAEVVNLGDDTRWLKLSEKGTVSPMKLKSIPKNCTIEFDIATSDPYSFYQNGLHIYLVESKKENDIFDWTRFRRGDNGIDIWLHPMDAANNKNGGRTTMTIYQNGQKTMNNRKSQNHFTVRNSPAKVGIWRQEGRLRVYIDGQKIWDLPRAFDAGTNYNRLTFYNENSDGNVLYISNLRVAKAGADTRHALLETGTFTTSDILFASGSARIASSSYPILDEIGTIMKDNPSKKLSITGHTDRDGEAISNQKLSEDRAKSVKMYLIKNFDIANSRISTQGKGEDQPIASNSSDSGKKQNRRVEFKLN